MKLTRSKRILLILLALVLAALCATAAEVIARRIWEDEQDFTFPVFLDGSEAFNLHSVEIEDNNLTVTGSDPRFIVSAHTQTFSRIRIRFKTPLTQDTELKIYYVPAGGSITEDDSIVKIIEAGTKQAFVYIPRGTYDYLRFDFEQDVSFEGIYVGDREWALKPYQTDPLRIGVIFAVIFLPLCVLILTQPKKTKKPILTILACNTFFSLTITTFQPLEQILINNNYLQLPFSNIWWVQLLLGIGITLILALLMLLLPPKAGSIAASVSLGLGLSYLAQSLLFNAGRPLALDYNWPMKLLSVHVWLGIVILITSLGAYSLKQDRPRQKTAERIKTICAWLLIIIQAVNLVILATSADLSGPREEQVPIKTVFNISMERGLPFLLKDNFPTE